MKKISALLATLLACTAFGDIIFVRAWSGRVHDSDGYTRGLIDEIRETAHGEFQYGTVHLPIYDNIDYDPTTNYIRLRSGDLDGNGNCAGKVYHDKFPYWKPIQFKLFRRGMTADIVIDYDDYVWDGTAWNYVHQHFEGTLIQRWIP